MSILPLPEEPFWSRLPALSAAGGATRAGDGTFVLPTDAGDLLIDALADGVRLRIGTQGPAYPILVGEPRIEPATIDANVDRTVIAWGAFRLTLGYAPLTVRLEKNGRLVQQSATDGHFVREHRLPPFARRPEGGWFAALDLAAGEPVYGLGE